MPLDADDESRLGQAHRFDLPIRRHGLDPKPRGRAIDALRVQRIDHDLARSRKGCQKPSQGQRNTVRRAVGSIGRIFSRAVIEPARELVHPLM